MQVEKLMVDSAALQAVLVNELAARGEQGKDAVLASLCIALGLDLSLWPIAASSAGKVFATIGRLTGQGLNAEGIRGTGAIQHMTETESLPAGPVVSCIASVPELSVPPEIEAALIEAGVEPDAVSSLYFHPASGRHFRQRIRSKWRAFTDLCRRGLIQNPTGFWLQAVRENWMLSSSYQPGKRKEQPTPEAQVAAARQAAAEQAQQQLDALIDAAPAEQWAASGPTLRLLLRSLLNKAELERLETLARTGILRATEIAREASRAHASGALHAWTQGLRLHLA